MPDGVLYGHADPDFSDLRIFDVRGTPVPWRHRREAASPAERSVRVLDSGRRGGTAVARIDLGAGHGAIDHVTLQVPDSRFVGSATVYGSDDRRTWTRLSTTQIYAVGGASPARSTTALLPRTDFRYLEVRAAHVSRIAGATVAAPPEEQQLPRHDSERLPRAALARAGARPGALGPERQNRSARVLDTRSFAQRHRSLVTLALAAAAAALIATTALALRRR